METPVQTCYVSFRADFTLKEVQISDQNMCGRCFPALSSATFKPLRYRPGHRGAWSGHLPFARDLIESLRPRLLVELGVHYGESYFGFCQSMMEGQCEGVCFAVDTWAGDAHAGTYGDEVYRDVEDYNNANYRAFSYLLRTTFDEALDRFSAGTIDLLHIDGLHTYSAVKRDFENWLPKVRSGGIVLLHDIDARHEGFGVWRLWEEVSREYKSFAFHHSHGLGVIRMPDGPAVGSGVLDYLFEPENVKTIRNYYVLCAERQEAGYRPQPAENGTVAQVFWGEAGGYAEGESRTASVCIGAWQKVTFELTEGIGDLPLRFDPTDHVAVIELGCIALRHCFDGRDLWRVSSRCELSATVAIGGTCQLLPDGDSLALFSYGCDPQVFVSIPPEVPRDEPVLMECWMRVQRDLSAVVRCFPELTPTIEEQAAGDFSGAAEAGGTVQPQPEPFFAQVFCSERGVYSEHNSKAVSVSIGSWEKITFELGGGLGDGPVRLDPINRPALIEIGAITLRHCFDDREIWRVPLIAGPGTAVSPAGTTCVLPNEDMFTLFSYGADPQLFLSVPPEIPPDQPVSLQCWMRIQKDLSAVAALVNPVRSRAVGRPEAPKETQKLWTDPAADVLAGLTSDQSDYAALELSQPVESNDCSAVGGKANTWIAETTDPWMIIPVDLCPAEFRYFILTMTCWSEASSLRAQLFWSGPERPRFEERLSISFPIIGDSQQHSYLIDLHQGAELHGLNYNWWRRARIDKVRLDPSDSPAIFTIHAAGFVHQNRGDIATVRQLLGIGALRAELSWRYLRGVGVEIGVLHGPFPVRPDAYIRYADRLTVEEARREHPELVTIPVVKPSILCDAADLAPIADSALDFIVANDILEHTVDPLGALWEWLRVIRAGGYMYVAVSAHANPLESLRPSTSLAHLIADFESRNARLAIDRTHYREWVEGARATAADIEKEQLVHDLIAQQYAIHFHTFCRETFDALLREAACRFAAELIECRQGVEGERAEFIGLIRKM